MIMPDIRMAEDEDPLHALPFIQEADLLLVNVACLCMNPFAPRINCSNALVARQ